MAFDTYQDLQDNIRNWLNKENSDTLARIPDFIRLGEIRIFRKLRSRYNEARLVYPSGGTNPQGITLPDDYRETKYLLWDGRQLTRKSDQWFFSRDPTETQQTPVYYARTQQNLVEFWYPPDEDAEVVLAYYQTQGPISDAVIPELYTEFPDLYLWASLLEAEPYLKHKELGSFWIARYEEAYQALVDEDDGEEYSGSTTEVSAVYSDGNDRRGGIGYY